MKKLIALTLCIVMTLTLGVTVMAENAVNWELKDGILTISGNGDMQDYKSDEDVPWYKSRTDVKEIVIENGVTKIGNFAFYGCTNAKSATIPNSVEKIGLNAFAFSEGTMTEINNASAEFVFNVKSESKAVNKGEEFYIDINITGDFKDVSLIQGSLVFDSKRISADEDDWCDPKWLDTIDETNLGQISEPGNGVVKNTARFLYLSLSGDKIDDKSPLYTKGTTTLTAARLKFKALEDIEDVNVTCFNLKDNKISVSKDNKSTDATTAAVQLTNTVLRPLSELTIITANEKALIYSAAYGLNAQIVKDDSGVALAKPGEETKKPDEVTVYVDGEKIEFDVKPMLVNGRTLVPMRSIFESIGALVNWDDETRTAFAMRGNTLIAVQIDHDIMTKSIVNSTNEEIKLDVPAKLVNSRTLVPLRAISEAFDLKVDWDDTLWKVTVTTK